MISINTKKFLLLKALVISFALCVLWLFLALILQEDTIVIREATASSQRDNLGITGTIEFQKANIKLSVPFLKFYFQKPVFSGKAKFETFGSDEVSVESIINGNFYTDPVWEFNWVVLMYLYAHILVFVVIIQYSAILWRGYFHKRVKDEI